MRWSSMMTSKGCFSARSLRFSVRSSAHGWLGPMHFTRRSTAVYASRAIRPSLMRRNSISGPCALGTPVEGRYSAGGMKGWSGSGPRESSSPRGGAVSICSGGVSSMKSRADLMLRRYRDTSSLAAISTDQIVNPVTVLAQPRPASLTLPGLCVPIGRACGAYLPASSPLRGEVVSPASSPVGVPVPVACASAWPSSGTCATCAPCSTPEVLRGGGDRGWY